MCGEGGECGECGILVTIAVGLSNTPVATMPPRRTSRRRRSAGAPGGVTFQWLAARQGRREVGASVVLGVIKQRWIDDESILKALSAMRRLSYGIGRHLD